MSLREWPAECHQVVQGQWCHWSEGPGSESRRTLGLYRNSIVSALRGRRRGLYTFREPSSVERHQVVQDGWYTFIAFIAVYCSPHEPS